MSGRRDSGIAIIGMQGRFPGARDLEAFWRNLVEGVESITYLTETEMKAAGVPENVIRMPGYVNAASILDEVDLFDAGFFHYSPRDAELTDPQHRIFLETAWTSLENAGYNPYTFGGSIGVFAGCELSGYLYQLYLNLEQLGFVDGMQLMVTNDKDHLATQVSYRLNLRGPSVVVQSTCSTSLVAVALACQSLLDRSSDMTLAGGVTVKVPQRRGYYYMPGGILSPDGRCRPFDASAQGTIVGSGVAIVVLKRLADAIRDRDHIHAVIRGFGINNDGSGKAGYTAPSVEGQVRAIRQAHRMAGFDPNTIGYIEAHGTATLLGDPIEVSAMVQAFGRKGRTPPHCALGSVKGNFGHLSCAAGATGLIKTALMVERGQIPPCVNFHQPNPAIDFANSPFYVNAELKAWPKTRSPRRAGVSAFGVGGTNVHVLLEEAPPRRPSSSSPSPHLLIVSARSDQACEESQRRLEAYLADHSTPLPDVAYTLQVGRHAFPWRRFAILDDDGKILVRSSVTGPAADRPVVFMFSGQGTQYPQMGRALYDTEPVFRREVDACAKALHGELHRDIREVLFPARKGKAAAATLQQTAFTQPALFVIEFALARLYQSWGIRPVALIGHSIGEYVAAAVSGTLSRAQALRLVARRGRLMGGLRRGGMVAVMVSEQEARRWLTDNISLAAVNAPQACTLAGPPRAIAGLERRLASAGIGFRRLHTSHAFHSFMMDPILKPFLATVRGISMNHPGIPYVSNLTGDWVTAPTLRNPAYWAMHIRSAVLFSQGLSTIMDKHPDAVFLEIGPGQALTALAKQHRTRGTPPIAVPSLPSPNDSRDDRLVLLTAVGEAWRHGVSIDWSRFWSHQRRNRVKLPTYPFERQRYWIGAPDRLDEETRLLMEQARDVGAWFWIPETVPEKGGTPDAVFEPAPEASPEEAILQALQFAKQYRQGRLRMQSPWPNGLAGAARVLSQEFPGLQVSAPGPTSYRPITLPATRPSILREGGVYLITGGLGHIGLTLAEYLAREWKAKLILVARSRFPDRKDWPKWLDRPSPTTLQDDLARKVEAVAALEAHGAEVLVVQADIAAVGQARQLVERAKARFGAIHGIIHGAGNLSASAFAPARETTAAIIEAQFSPKVRGLLALREALAGDPIDFWFLHSSISAVLGGIGLLAYAAANAWLDSYAEAQRATDPSRWISVNWDAWNFPGYTGLPKEAIQAKEGQAAFERILASDLTHVVVSVTDLPARLDRWVRGVQDPVPEPKSAAHLHPRQNLSTEFVAPGTDTERRVAEVWQGLLGITPIGVHDTFFELGGHSLLAIQVALELGRVFSMDVPVEWLFEAPTVGGLAARLEANQSAQTPSPDSPPEPSPTDTPVESPPQTTGLALDQAFSAEAETAKGGYRKFYDEVSRQLDSTTAGSYSYFLNYGYVSTGKEDRSPIPLPEHVLNRNSVKLVLEVVGGLDLAGKNILDVGCGRGGTLHTLAKYYAIRSGTGLDLSGEAIRFCRRVHPDPRLTFEEGDAERLPFPEETFDVVTNLESSHTYPHVAKFYGEVWRVLKPGGWFLYADLLSAERIAEGHALLQALGFGLESARDITQNVLRSCDGIAAQRAHMFQKAGDPSLVGEFLAAPGSQVYENMRTGAWQYGIWQFRKP